jgi:hypothetical protein
VAPARIASVGQRKTCCITKPLHRMIALSAAIGIPKAG